MRRRVGAVAWAAWVGAAVAASPALAETQCARWDLSGRWYITQSNVELGVTFELQQQGNTLTGHARWAELKGEPYMGIFPRGKDPVPHFGSVDGEVNGQQLELQVYWPDHKAVGVYSGQIGPRGRIEGTTYDRLHPANRATWFSEGLMQCAKASESKPLRALGKRKPDSKIQKESAIVEQPIGGIKAPEAVDSLRLQPGVGRLKLQVPKTPCTPPRC